MHDGAVHIESNDIIGHLERTFPTPRLIPERYSRTRSRRCSSTRTICISICGTLSFRFVFAPPGPPKPAEALKSYAGNGSGTVRGVKDRDKEVQIEFWRARSQGRGFTERWRGASAQKFRVEIRRARSTESGKAALSARRCAQRARHRVVHLRQPARAGRLSDRSGCIRASGAWLDTLAGSVRSSPKEVGDAAGRRKESASQATRRAHAQAGKSLRDGGRVLANTVVLDVERLPRAPTLPLVGGCDRTKRSKRAGGVTSALNESRSQRPQSLPTRGRGAHRARWHTLRRVQRDILYT